MGKLLEVKGLVTQFKVDKNKIINAVDRSSFTLDEGETLAIVGESGSGKSVTALSVMGLVPNPPGHIEAGEILLQGRDLLKLSKKEMRSIRGNHISMIFQEPMTSLNPVYTMGRQIAEIHSPAHGPVQEGRGGPGRGDCCARCRFPTRKSG